VDEMGGTCSIHGEIPAYEFYEVNLGQVGVYDVYDFTTKMAPVEIRCKGKKGKFEVVPLLN
jgi:hypothetical protein